MSKAIELEENINDAICRVLADSEDSEIEKVKKYFECLTIEDMIDLALSEL